jgi:hypothetical protein
MTAAVQALLNGVFRDVTVLNPLLIVVPSIVDFFGGDAGEIVHHPEWDVFASRLQQRLDARVRYWLAMAVLLLLWPVAVRYGRWLLHRSTQAVTPFRPEAYKAPLLSAAIMIGLLGLYSEVARYEPPPQGWLSAGDYSLNHFNPALSLSIGRGWYIFPTPQMYDVAIVAPDVAARQGMIWFQNVHKVYSPTYAPYLSSARVTHAYREKFNKDLLSDPRYHEAAPKDMSGWFKKHPYLKTTHSSPIVIGGAHGEQFDARVSLPHRFEADNEAECLPLFYHGVTGDDDWFVLCKSKVRVIVVDIRGETVVIVIAAPTDDFSNFLRAANQVLDSVRWGK